MIDPALDPLQRADDELHHLQPVLDHGRRHRTVQHGVTAGRASLRLLKKRSTGWFKAGWLLKGARQLRARYGVAGPVINQARPWQLHSWLFFQPL